CGSVGTVNGGGTDARAGIKDVDGRFQLLAQLMQIIAERRSARIVGGAHAQGTGRVHFLKPLVDAVAEVSLGRGVGAAHAQTARSHLYGRWTVELLIHGAVEHGYDIVQEKAEIAHPHVIEGTEFLAKQGEVLGRALWGRGIGDGA